MKKCIQFLCEFQAIDFETIEILKMVAKYPEDPKLENKIRINWANAIIKLFSNRLRFLRNYRKFYYLANVRD